MMTIIFLCGCLEPGQDGVGDYTRRLAAELCRQRHQVSLVALSDRHITDTVQTGNQQEEEQTIPVLRLSSRLSWQERTNLTRTYIDTVRPDWISLQYVPFSFHDKGTPFRLIIALNSLSKDRKLHIMFHELWLGMTIGSSKLHIVWGAVQRCIVRLLMFCAQPAVTHSQLPLYKHQLNKIGANTLLLPLFSNIPNLNFSSDIGRHTRSLKDSISFVFFGTIFPSMLVQEFTNEVVSYATAKGISVELIIIGRNGAEQETWATAWRSRGLDVTQLGEQTPAGISANFNKASVGLSTTPALLAGKSGSIAAMHTHGLPVLCIANPLKSHHTPDNMPGVFVYEKGNLAQLLSCFEVIKLPAITIAGVTQQFVNDLATY